MPQYERTGLSVASAAPWGSSFNFSFRRAMALGLAAGFAVLIVLGQCAAARAGDDDDETKASPSFTDQFMRTLGLKNANDEDINYAERSPLVVPPTRDLPAPAKVNVPANWPKDPDVLRRKAAKNDDKPVVRQGDSVIESERALRPDELGVRATPGVSAPGVGEQSTASQRGQPGKSLLNFDWLKSEQTATFTGEPPRVSLTDPPPGYLTPSPDYPYGIAPEKKAYRPATLGERMELQK